MKYIAQYKEYFLVGIICVLSLMYYIGNFPKLAYFQKKIVTPLLNAQSQNQQSDVIQVEIKNPQNSRRSALIRKSFVRNAIVTPLGREIVIMDVPQEIDLEFISESVYIEDQKVTTISVDEHILYANYENVRLYIINKNYKENMTSILQLENATNL